MTTTDTPPRLKVELGGREILLLIPTQDQFLAVQMMSASDLPDARLMDVIGAMLLSLVTSEDDKVAILVGLARGEVTMAGFMETFGKAAERLGEELQAEQNTPVSDGAAAKKRAVKRASSPRTASGRRKTPAK